MKNKTYYARQLCGLTLALVGLVIGLGALLASANVAASAKKSSPAPTSTASGQENPLSLNRWSSNGPDGGPVLALAIDRNNPATLYAGTPTGVFKSTNGGESWTSSLANTYVQILAIAPTTPTTLFAAGSSGIQKSTDGGASWNAVNNGLENQNGPINVLALAIDPTNENIVYAAGPDITDPSVTYKAIYKSTDGGGSWRFTKHSIRSFAVHHALAIDPISSNTIYAGGSVGNGTVWKSTDDGKFWTIVDVGFDSRSTVYTMAIDPTNTNLIYVGTEALGVYKSSDGGGSWSARNDGLQIDNDPTSFVGVRALAFEPGNPGVIYAGTYRGVFKSSNGGSWSALNGGLTNLSALAIDASNRSIIYAGTDAGIFKSINGGTSWRATNQGLRGVSVSSVAANPGKATVYAGADSATFSSSDNGGSWIANDFYPLAIDPSKSNTIYATRVTGRDGLSKSTDGGATWTSANTGLENNYIYSLAIDPANSEIVYAGTDGSLFKTTNGGGSWGVVGDLSFVVSIAIDPKNSQTLYALAPDCYTSPVYKSSDGGVTWKPSDAGSTPFYANLILAVDSVDTSTIYVSAYSVQAQADRLFKSTDGGGSWSAIDTGPINDPFSLVIDPVHSNRLYAGTHGDGVFKSDDGGTTWNPFNDGLTNLNIDALAIDASGNFLHAGTPSGVFDIQLRSNQIDDAQFFVRQHYLDFLNREPDAPGLAHWTDEITECSDPSKRQPGESLVLCTERKRANTSAAFFLSPEFQNTGSFVLRVYWGTLGKLPSAQCGLPDGLLGQCRPLYSDYLADMSQVARGIVVNDKLAPEIINANKRAFVDQFVNKAEFRAGYDALNNQQFVDKLFTTTEIVPSDSERSALVNGLNAGTETRSSVVFKVVDGTETITDGALVFQTTYGKAFFDQEFDAAFVFMEYVGYLRRNPDQEGYDFWLAKMRRYGNWMDAEMVRAFIVSPEYRQRFGP